MTGPLFCRGKRVGAEKPRSTDEILLSSDYNLHLVPVGNNRVICDVGGETSSPRLTLRIVALTTTKSNDFAALKQICIHRQNEALASDSAAF